MSNFFAQTEHCCSKSAAVVQAEFQNKESQGRSKFLLPFKVLRVTNQRIPS
jgi:hypothetical protein